MKKILVMSDSHGNKGNVLRAYNRFSDVDCIVHLGDFLKDTECITANMQVYTVKGNGDFYLKGKNERVITIGGKKILMLHGHKQRVKTGLLALGLYAREKDADIALFGHTHIPTEQMYEGVLLYNPGSLSGFSKPTVGVITIDGDNVKIKTYAL